MKGFGKKDNEQGAGMQGTAQGVGAQGAGTQAELDKMQSALMELTGDLQRTRADFENYRKQIEAQKENEKRAARLATVYKVLPLIDDFDRAIATYKELEPLKKSLDKTLKELGVARIASATGEVFNPDIHEAVMAEGDGDTEVVAETLRTGYYYEGEVLRPAMVKVTRK